MRSWLSQILRLALMVGAAVTLAACGGGTSGGSGAAPTGGSDTPVAVEIPALGEVSGLPFASGVVVTGSSDIVAALKARPGSWVAKSFNVTTDTFTTGDSKAACEYRNTAAITMISMSLPDQTLCVIKDNIASFTSPYNGSYHVFLQQAASGTMPAGIPSKVKFKIDRDSNNIITAYESFVCDNTDTQLTHVTYAISSRTLTAALKTIHTAVPQRSAVTLAGTLNTADPTQYTAKSGTYSFTGTDDSGALEGAISMTQAVSTMLLDGFDSRGGGSSVVRIYGQADQSNTSDPLNMSDYLFGAGAATVIDNGSSSTECWDGTTNDPTTCTGSNYDAINGKTPQTAATQTISAFSGSDAWDCSGDVETTVTIPAFGSEDSTACYRRFNVESTHIDCTNATDGGFTVTASGSAGGTAFSTSLSSPTSLTPPPQLVFTLNRPADTSTFNSTTVTMVDTSDDSAVDLGNFSSGWSSDYKQLTLSPATTFNKTYRLTITGGSSGVKSTTGATPTMSATVTYYVKSF